MGNSTIIGYIRTFFDIISSQLDAALEQINHENFDDHEKIIQRLEGEVRGHLGIQSQMKIFNE